MFTTTNTANPTQRKTNLRGLPTVADEDAMMTPRGSVRCVGESFCISFRARWDDAGAKRKTANR
jgi:hypothetical protein